MIIKHKVSGKRIEADIETRLIYIGYLLDDSGKRILVGDQFQKAVITKENAEIVDESKPPKKKNIIARVMDELETQANAVFDD